MKSRLFEKKTLSICVLFVLAISMSGCVLPSNIPSLSPIPTSTNSPTPSPIFTPTISLTPLHTLAPTNAHNSIRILVDDFIPQPYQGDAVYSYNRLEGDRGALNNSIITWGNGLATATISEGNSWGGLWMSLNHPIREGQSINFSAILPSQILPQYQSRITGITVSIAEGTAAKTFRAELKDSDNNLKWSREVILSGERQTLSVALPLLQEINHLVLVLDHAAAGDFVTIDHISLAATTPISDTAIAAFVWSYGMLLNNWNPATGLVRDKAKDTSSEFDAIQATGSLAAATALAEQVGVIDHVEAVAIVNKIGDTLLNKLPRNHGLWPHWVTMSSNGNFEIVTGTEWSSVDTVIAAIGLLDAQQALGLETSSTEQMLRDIDWNNLVSDKGISHGYTFDNVLIPYTWDVFGGESWLVELAYASATGKIAPLAYPSAPTANGSGFIDELAWLYVKPPTKADYWGTDWASYRAASAEKQISYYVTADTTSCFAKLGLFGLSAAEAPIPAQTPKENIYQAFGKGGQFAPVNDGTTLLGSPTTVPHYSAMIASLNSQAAIKMWDWLITNGYFSPLNNIESLTFPSRSNCDATGVLWNQLKGSWNLSLQTLGWGRYIVERKGKIPAMWQSTTENLFLEMGYLLLAHDEPKPSAVNMPQASESPGTPIWDRAQISCDGKPVDQWGLPGTYLYKYGEDAFITIVRKPGDEGPKLGVYGPTGSSSKLGVETVTTGLGTFEATVFSTSRDYSILTGRTDYYQGSFHRTEWYVCGYGLVKLTSSDVGKRTPGLPSSYSSIENFYLLSFTPLTTNEFYIRYILADIQLGNLADFYRANITDEETAEALRRWDAGMRVINIDRFERKLVGEKVLIVYAGTNTFIQSMDVKLSSAAQR